MPTRIPCSGHVRPATRITGFQPREEVKVIQNLWADRVGKARLDIRFAPEVVMRAIERSKRGYELFGRVREAPELVVYELKTLT